MDYKLLETIFMHAMVASAIGFAVVVWSFIIAVVVSVF